MKYIDFHGRSLAQIALGCDYWGSEISRETALKQLDLYWEAGGNFLDTAAGYGQERVGGPSTSEQVVGEWLSSNAMYDKITVATKGCLPPRDDMHKSRINEQAMLEDVSRSLEQLKADRLDIWFFHRDNPAIPTDEIVDLAQILIEQGLVTHLGVSNWKADRIEAANRWAEEHSRQQFAISQIQFSLATCTPEIWGDDTLVCMNEDELSWYRQSKLPVMGYSSQAKGLFSKILAGREVELSEKARRRFITEENLARVDRVGTLAAELAVSPAAIAMAYLTSQSNPTIAIAGSSRVEQIAETVSESSLTLTEAQLSYLYG
jgi:aryl-alcohol dehydrogenase-like predicted oxidoreductase